MNSSTLSSVDDLTKFLVLDPYLGFNTKKSTKLEINLSDGAKDKLQQLSDLHKVKNDKPETVMALIEFCNNNHNLLYHFNISKIKWIKNHIQMYLHCLSSQSLVSIVKCASYSVENYEGVAVVAKTKIKSNTIISELRGIKKYVSEEEVKILQAQNIDFSIMSSTRSKLPILLLGTAALINHHCTPNCAYKAISSSEVVINTIKDIQINEELFCFYGSDYFDSNNVNCECSDCKSNKEIAKQFDGSSEIHQNTSPESDDNNMVNSNNNGSKADDLLKIYSNIRKFTIFVKNLEIDETEIYDNEQRRVHLISGKGLNYDNCLYTRFIKFFKLKQNRIQITEKYEPTDEDLMNIVQELYKNDHANNYRSVRNFISKHKTTISSDIKEYGDKDLILSPGCKQMEKYFHNLTKIMILTCFEEFAICIYKGGKIPTEFKEVILKHLSAGSKVTRSDRTKLDNSLAKYKNYLREVTEKLISNVTTDVHAFFEKNQPYVMLSSDDLSVANSDSIASCENSLKSCKECSVNIEFNDSLSSLIVDQLKNIIGV